MGSKLGVLRRVAAGATLALMVAATATVGNLASTQPVFAQSASTIVVQGNRRVDAETIRSYFQLRPGERLDSVKIDEALKALYATGLYEDVRINQVGGRLVVIVVENSTINRIAFEGNKKVKDESLTSEIQSRPRGALSRPTVQADVQRIIDVYRRQGLLNVRVDPKVIDQPNGRVDLVFEINEGDKTTIKKIVFIGNNKFSDFKLRDTITSQQTNWLSFLNNRDLYDADRVSADQEILRRFYLKNGYADFRIISATVDLDSKEGGFVLTLTLDEGQQYKFGTINVVSNLRDVNADDLSRLLRTKSGGTYNAEQVEKSIELITIELSKRGYAFAQVRPRGDRDVTNFVINITFVVEEGSRIYVERINVRGNTRTRDHVIRREFDILEGDPYNRVLVDRAERRLKNLGYFKTTRVTNEPGSAADRIVLNVEVEEQLTGEFSIGGGYSTTDGVIGEVSVGERNFLGRGQHVKISAGYGQRVRSAEFSFTEPYFLGTRVAAGFDIFTKTNLRSTYNPVDLTTTGMNLRFGLPLKEELTLGLRYSIYNRKVDIDPRYRDGCTVDSTGAPIVTNPTIAGTTCDIDNLPAAGNQPGNLAEVSNAYKQLQGERLTSLVGYSLIHNSLNENQNPTEGSFINFAQDFAGVGGDVKFFKTSIDNRNYFPVTDDITGIIRLQGGYIAGWGGHELLVLDHFFMGPNLVRGFAPAGIGPRDLGSTGRDALGGSMYWGASAELMFPFPNLPKEFGLKGAVFADVGNSWGYKGSTTFTGAIAPVPCPSGSSLKGSICLADANQIRSSVGMSLIWASPMGPLRFDYSFVLSKDSADKTQAFRFGMGQRF